MFIGQEPEINQRNFIVLRRTNLCSVAVDLMYNVIELGMSTISRISHIIQFDGYICEPSNIYST